MANNNGKKRKEKRREAALERQAAYDKLTLDQKLAKAPPSTAQFKKLLAIKESQNGQEV